MAILRVWLDDELERDLAHIARRQNRTKSALVRHILRRYMSAELFVAARERLRPYAEKSGYLTEEDFFRDFS